VRGGKRKMNELYKIGEAKFFLARMEESVHDREVFRYNLSAFLAAARSVTKYAQEEAKSKGKQQWYLQTIVANDLLRHSTQTGGVRHRFGDWPGSEDPVGSKQRYSKSLIGLSQRYIEELEKFVEIGTKEGILSGNTVGVITTDPPASSLPHPEVPRPRKWRELHVQSLFGLKAK